MNNGKEIFDEIVMGEQPDYVVKNTVVVIHRNEDSIKEVLVEFDFGSFVVYSLSRLLFHQDEGYYLLVESYFDMESLRKESDPFKTTKIVFEGMTLDDMFQLYDDHVCTTV